MSDVLGLIYPEEYAAHASVPLDTVREWLSAEGFPTNYKRKWSLWEWEKLRSAWEANIPVPCREDTESEVHSDEASSDQVVGDNGVSGGACRPGDREAEG